MTTEDSIHQGAGENLPLILVGYDFSEESEAAVLEAGRLAKLEGYRVGLIFCIGDELPHQIAMGGHQRILKQHRMAASEELTRLGERTLNVPFSVMVVDGTPRRAIIRTARQERAKLIVLASSTHSLAAGILLGSTAEAVARHAHCSVLLFR